MRCYLINFIIENEIYVVVYSLLGVEAAGPRVVAERGEVGTVTVWLGFFEGMQMKFRVVLCVVLASGVLAQTVSAAPSASEQTCRACHELDNTKVGPPFRKIAASYRNDPDALAKIKRSILEGSHGKWGSMTMPPNPVTDEEATRFAQWVLSLNK